MVLVIVSSQYTNQAEATGEILPFGAPQPNQTKKANSEPNLKVHALLVGGAAAAFRTLHFNQDFNYHLRVKTKQELIIIANWTWWLLESAFSLRGHIGP